MKPDAAKRGEDLGFFWFLVDAPMYIDNMLVERVHDAIIRPDVVEVARDSRSSSTDLRERTYALGGKGGVKVPFVLTLALDGKFGHKYGVTKGQEAVQQFTVPRTPERLLEEFVAFYLAHFADRVLLVDPGDGRVWSPSGSGELTYDALNEVCDRPGPRPIVLFDAPQGTKMLPMAGEFRDGKVEVIYDQLVAALRDQGKQVLSFNTSPALKGNDRVPIWKSLIDSFDSQVARLTLERTTDNHKGERFDWIDFRMPWKDAADPSPFHLHLMPNQRYSMGTFAHAFINRAYNHGVRIVGLLKRGGDVNVLAIYER